MPIIDTEIQYRFSGGASNSNPNASLGGVKSSVSIGSTLFDDVSSAEAAAGSVEYRCYYIHNANATPHPNCAEGVHPFEHSKSHDNS